MIECELLFNFVLFKVIIFWLIEIFGFAVIILRMFLLNLIEMDVLFCKGFVRVK